MLSTSSSYRRIPPRVAAAGCAAVAAVDGPRCGLRAADVRDQATVTVDGSGVGERGPGACRVAGVVGGGNDCEDVVDGEVVGVAGRHESFQQLTV